MGRDNDRVYGHEHLASHERAGDATTLSRRSRGGTSLRPLGRKVSSQSMQITGRVERGSVGAGALDSDTSAWRVAEGTYWRHLLGRTGKSARCLELYKH